MKPPDDEASRRQSTLPPALTISQALLPRDPDVTLNRATSAGGRTVRTAARVTPAYVAWIVTPRSAGTVEVSTLKLAVVAPLGTVTLAGTLATSGLPLCSVTTIPSVGAAAVSVTVAVGDDCPSTVDGSSASESSATGVG